MWPSNPDLRCLVYTTCAMLLGRQTTAQSACPSVRTLGTVYEQAVMINTDVLTNTTLYPIPEVAVTISNAPTSINGITTFHWTKTQIDLDPVTIVSRTSSVLSATPTIALNEFVLMIQSNVQRTHDKRKIHGEKRQSGTYYVNGNGEMTNDCTAAPVYSIKDGVLTSTVNGTVYTYSTSPGVPYAQFIPNTIPGSITTTFALGPGGVLNWLHEGFHNGQASFCTIANGTVYAVFQQDAQPEGCLFIALSLFSVSSCQALAMSTITGPTGPTGATVSK